MSLRENLQQAGTGIAQSLARTWAEGRAELDAISKSGFTDPIQYQNVADIEDSLRVAAKMSGLSQEERIGLMRLGIREAAQARGSRVTEQDLAELL